MGRSCGPCTACCHALVIPELNKPGFVPCPEAVAAADAADPACAGGCGRYDARPGSCQNFRCLWLDGHLAEADRPDRLGVVFTTASHEQLGTLPMLIEVRPDAVGQPSVRRAIAQLTRQTHLIVSTAQGGRLHWKRAGPPPIGVPLTIEGHAA